MCANEPLKAIHDGSRAAKEDTWNLWMLKSVIGGCIARLEPHLAKNGRAWSLFCLRPCAELLRCCLQTSGMMRVQHSNKEGDSYLVISLSPCSPTVPTLSTFFGDIER